MLLVVCEFFDLVFVSSNLRLIVSRVRLQVREFLAKLINLGIDRLLNVLAYEDVATRRIPSGNLMTPPQLPADAPVLDVVQPLRVSGRPVFRHKFDVAVAHGIQRWLRDRL